MDLQRIMTLIGIPGCNNTITPPPQKKSVTFVKLLKTSTFFSPDGSVNQTKILRFNSSNLPHKHSSNVECR